MPLEIDNEIRQKLEEIGVMTLSDLLRKANITDFERKILSAVFWSAKAHIQALPEFRLLCLMTSLEAILNPHGNRPIRMGVAEGAALLIGRDLGERRYIRDLIARLYNLRSSVAHGGHPEVLEIELRRLTSINGAVILDLLKRIGEFKTQKELLNWLDDRRLC